jgi:hypothetical protein
MIAFAAVTPHFDLRPDEWGWKNTIKTNCLATFLCKNLERGTIPKE